MHGSAAAFPAYLFQFAVFYDGRDRRVAAAEGKHFRAKLKVVLRISIFEMRPLLCIVLTRLRAMRAAGLCVYY